MRTLKKALYCLQVAVLGEGSDKVSNLVKTQCNTIIVMTIMLIIIIIIHFFHPLLQTHLTQSHYWNIPE